MIPQNQRCALRSQHIPIATRITAKHINVVSAMSGPATCRTRKYTGNKMARRTSRAFPLESSCTSSSFFSTSGSSNKLIKSPRHAIVVIIHHSLFSLNIIHRHPADSARGCLGIKRSLLPPFATTREGWGTHIKLTVRVGTRICSVLRILGYPAGLSRGLGVCGRGGRGGGRGG